MRKVAIAALVSTWIVMPTHGAVAQCNLQAPAGWMCGVSIDGPGLPRLGQSTAFGMPTFAGPRGPLFVQNDATSVGNPAGKNMGCQFWVGNNPTATPGAGHSVNCTMYIDNNNRQYLFGLNVVTSVNDLGPGWADTTISALEAEVHNFFAAHAGTDPFGPSPTRKNGISVTTGFGTVGHSTAAFLNWGAERSGAGWVDTAFAASSAYNYGWRCIANPGGDADLTPAFKTACLSDESNSATILRGTGSHVNGVDLRNALFSGPTFASNFFAVSPDGNTFVNSVQTNVFAVAGLFLCNSDSIGVRSFVKDATATMAAGIGTVVVGGSTNKVPVFCDGEYWRIGG